MSFLLLNVYLIIIRKTYNIIDDYYDYIYRVGKRQEERKGKLGYMELWHWFRNCVLAGVGAGLLKLHDDIQTCGYEDVQVMWEMLRRTESEFMSHPNSNNNRKPQRPFWRNFCMVQPHWYFRNQDHRSLTSFIFLLHNHHTCIHAQLPIHHAAQLQY